MIYKPRSSLLLFRSQWEKHHCDQTKHPALCRYPRVYTRETQDAEEWLAPPAVAPHVILSSAEGRGAKAGEELRCLEAKGITRRRVA